MCTNYVPPSHDELRERFRVDRHLTEIPYKAETWPDYNAPVIVHDNGARAAIVANYGFMPKRKIPPGVKKYSTMNSRSETVGTLRSFSSAWKAHQFCLVPMRAFYEPCYETGSAVRWRIGMADDSDFAVAGMWRKWDEENGEVSYSFTQLTVNADDHPLMRRFHKPGDEKRSLVIVPPEEYDAWMSCDNGEVARSFLRLFPTEKMTSRAEPVPPRTKKLD